jgi:ribosomal protein S18 acetylase RimI-like enzyme
MQFSAQSQSYAADYPGAVHEIVCFEGEPVGRIITDQSGEALRLVDIALLPACRGRGMGAALIGRLQEQCTAFNKPLRLHVAKTNRALHLYKRLGFAVLGETETHRLMEWHPRP